MLFFNWCNTLVLCLSVTKQMDPVYPHLCLSCQFAGICSSRVHLAGCNHTDAVGFALGGCSPLYTSLLHHCWQTSFDTRRCSR